MLRKTLNQLPLARPYLIVTVIAVTLFWPTWLRLFQEWLKWEQVLAHGLPTFLIFLGLLLIHPPAPSSRGPRFPLVGSVLLLLTVLAWGVLELVRIDTLAYLLLPAGMLTVCWTLYGFMAARAFLPYVLLCSLALPIWSDLVPLLVELATAVVSQLVAAMGITALIEGPNITLPYGRLVIADGCSGIRYFAISILLAMITAILNDFRWKGWLLAVTTGMAVALVVNWVRITALVVIAYQSEMQSELVTDHETFGWLVYAVFVIPIMLLAPVHRRNGMPDGTAPRFSLSGCGLLMAAFLVGPLGVSLAHSQANPSHPWTLSLEGTRAVSPDELPLPLQLPEGLEHSAWRTGPAGWISLAQSRKESRDDKLVPYLRGTVDTRQWFLESEVDDGIAVYQNLRTRQQVVIGKRYHVGDWNSRTYRSAKLLQIPAVLSGHDRFAVMTIQSRCGARDCQGAIQRVRELQKSVTLRASG